MKLFTKLIWILILSWVIASPVGAQRDVKEVVVKIYTVYNRHDYYEPWQMWGQQRRSGSGCIIRGRRILTNAHVVADQTFIQARRAGEALEDIKDGRYEGIRGLGMSWQEMENPDLRLKFGMTAEHTERLV